MFAKLIKHKFIENVVKMLVGNVSGQLVAFLAAPVITRLFLPEDFGIMTYIWSLTGIFSTIACCCYQNAIMLPRDDHQAFSLYAICVLSSFIVSISLVFLGPIFVSFIPEQFNNDNITKYIWLVGLGVFVFSVKDCTETLHARFSDFSLVSKSQIVTPVVTATSKILPGLLIGASAWWLVIGNILGQLVSLLFLVWFLRKIPVKVSAQKILLGMKKVGHEYQKFPRYNLPTELINSFSQNVPVLLFSYYFTQDIVGFYGLATNILRRPITVISLAIRKILLQKTVEYEHANKSLLDFFKKTTMGLAVIALLPFLALMIWAKYIFVFIFGSNWEVAGLYAQILAPWLFLMFLTTPANQVVFVKQKLRFKLYFNYVILVVRVGTIFLSTIIYGDPVISLFVFSMFGCLLEISYIYSAYIFAKS